MGWILLIWSIIKPFVTGIYKKEMQLILPIVEKYVHQYNTEDMSGKDKQLAVFNAAVTELKQAHKDYYGSGDDIKRDVSTFLVNLAIELTLGKLRSDTAKS